jgi:hypothetical protein
MPALSISVEPSGIVPPFKVKFEFVPIEERGDATPLDVAQAGVVLGPNPPPSKAEPTGIEAISDPLNPVIPEDIPEYVAEPLVLQLEIGAGLKPPGSISVAPSGIPVPLFVPLGLPEPSIPMGEVTPVPVVLIGLWACAAATAEQDRSRYED